MITIDIKGVKEFSNAIHKAAIRSSREFPVFLHDQAQRFMWELSRVFRDARPLPDEIESAAMASLDSGAGLRVAKKHVTRARRSLGAVQDKTRRQLGRILAKKKITDRDRERARRLLKKHRERLNVYALAVQREIRSRRAASGSMSYAFTAGYRRLRALPLGQPFKDAQENRGGGYTWANFLEMARGQNEVNIRLENKGFRDNRPQNYRLVEEALRRRTNDMIARANAAVRKVWIQ